MSDPRRPTTRVSSTPPQAPVPSAPSRECYQDQLTSSRAEFEAWQRKGGFAGAAASHRPTVRRVRRLG